VFARSKKTGFFGQKRAWKARFGGIFSLVLFFSFEVWEECGGFEQFVADLAKLLSCQFFHLN